MNKRKGFTFSYSITHLSVFPGYEYEENMPITTNYNKQYNHVYAN